METKPAKKKIAGDLEILGQQVTKIAFSEGMGGAVASALGVPAKRRRGFQLAYVLLPLNRARECVDVAYYLATNGYPFYDIQSWLRRYERLSKTELPKWAKKNSRAYLKKAYAALAGGSEAHLRYILYEFKGFIYAVFCRALMERYADERAG